MPFKSHAHREKFKELLKLGKISQKTFNEYEKDTPKKLPARVGEAKPILSAHAIPKPTKR